MTQALVAAPARRPPGLSLRGRLIAANLAIGVLVSALVTALLLYQLWRDELALAEQRLDLAESVMVPSLAKGLWNFDEDLVKIALDGFASVPGVAQVQVVPTEGPAVERGQPPAEALIVREIPLAFGPQRVPVGHLVVRVGPERVHARLRARGTALALSSLALMLTTSVLLGALFNAWVTRHLSALARYAGELRVDRELPPLQLTRAMRVPPDDIDEVAGALERMRAHLQDYLRLQRAHETELLQGQQRLETQVRERTQELADSEARLRLIADNVPALISHIDPDRRFTFNNRVYEQWLKRPLAEITGKRIDEVYGADVYADLRPHLDAAFAGERSSFESEVQGRVYRVTYVPERDAKGAVAGIYGLAHDITHTKQVERELRLQAERDALTGLPNRRHFEAVFATAVARCERDGGALALLFMDIDRFKHINDSHGHQTGDEVLQEFARRLQRCVRRGDLVARLAGDEFVILLDGEVDAAAAAAVADKIQQALREPMQAGGLALAVGSSIGIALRRPQEHELAPLLHRADAALYQAKAAGRGCWRMDGAG